MGLILLPLTVGIGIGSLTTGRLVSRTGRTAIFPSIGMMMVVATLVALTLLADRLSDAQLMVLFVINSTFMGTVMGVVQVTVAMTAGKAMTGAAAGSVQFSRSIGAALGTSIVSATLFIRLSRTDPDTAALFGNLVELGPDAIANLLAARLAAVQGEISEAFRNAFEAVCAFAICGALLAWLIPSDGSTSESLVQTQSGAATWMS